MKYSDEELIQLTILNPGFGINRLLKVIFPSSDSDKRQRKRYDLIQLFNEYKEEFDENLYDLIQDPDYSTMVTENEYKQITGEKYLPQGRYMGRSTSRTSKASDGFGKGYNSRGGAQANIPLPPQDFDWGDILPIYERIDSNSREDNFLLRVYSNIKLRDFRKMWDAYQLVLPVKSPTLVSKYLDGDSPNSVIKWIPKMLEYNNENILEEWFEVIETLRIIEGNNALDDKELKVMFRGTFEDYVKDPINNEKPSKEDIFWVFNQLIEEFNSF
ncbi:hypothetical protein OAR96_01850 [Euryarchaeota archaeon]|nr:hypothetical protein [Euryarchaeota archaeon]